MTCNTGGTHSEVTKSDEYDSEGRAYLITSQMQTE